ncbi:hypothetical protein V4S33_00100 [Enterococcus cecorum]
MNIFSQEATQELQTMITEIIRKELPLVVAEVVREQIQPQGYIKADRVRKELLDGIAPQTLEEFKALGLKSYKMTSPRMTFYKKSDIDKFMMQFEQKNKHIERTQEKRGRLNMNKSDLEYYQKQLTQAIDLLATLANFDESTKFIEWQDGKEIHLNKYEVVRNTVKEVIDELEEIELVYFTELEDELQQRSE